MTHPSKRRSVWGNFTADALGPRFEHHRAVATRVIAYICVGAIALNTGVAFLAGTGMALHIFLISSVLGGAALLSLNAPPVARRVLIAMLVIGQCIALTTGLRGHPMQPDSHMMFLVAMTAIATFASLRGLVAAVGVTAVHHIAMTFIAPEFVFLSNDLGFNLFRASVHAVIVLMALTNLYLIVYVRLAQTASAQRHATKLEAAMAEAEEALAMAEVQKREALEAKALADEQTAAAAAAREKAETALQEAEQSAIKAQAATDEMEASQNAHKEQIAEVLSLFRDRMALVADGDLTARIDRSLPPEYADLAVSFNTAIAQLEQVFGEIQAEVSSIQDQSNEIKDTAQDLAQSTERQSSTLTEISASLQQLTSLLNEVATDTNSAQSQADNTRGQAETGTEIMSRTETAMDQIEASSGEIRKIIEVIENIAFQTNLLALNAGVEAARAGEAGRGFAVVATEVRALAQRSSEAAQEIDGLINKSVSQVSDGARLVKETGCALHEIRGSVDQIAEGMQTVAEKTIDQSRGLSGVNDAIGELDGATQQFASRFEETATANAVLFNNATRLSDLLSNFRVSGRGQDNRQSDVLLFDKDIARSG